MARRMYTTEVGFIACDELGDLGAGRKEGWLTDASVLAALHPNTLALASSSFVLVIHWSKSDYDGDNTPSLPIKIKPSLSSAEGDISAIEWLAFGDLLALAIGTSAGYLLLYSLDPLDLIHKQIVHSGRIQRLRFREVLGNEFDLDTLSHELCAVMPGVIARFDGLDIKSMLERWFLARQDYGWEHRREDGEGNQNSRIPYQLWNVNKFGSCVDAEITGLMPPPLLELQSEQRYYCAVTIGKDAVISAYRISENRSRSLVGTILSKVVPAAFSTITSFSKLIWRSEQPAARKPETPSQPFAKASPITCLKDLPRKGEKLTLSPSGTLAAIADSLGRILLLDTRALVIVRLWKGYRDASCLFMELLVGKDKGKSTTPYGHGYTKSDYFLCLAIHAPRKGIIEVWKMRTGPRLLTIPCPKGSKILQPSCRLSSSKTESSYIPLEVFLLNGDSGQLSVLNRSVG